MRQVRREDTFLEQLTVMGGTQQSGPSKISLEVTFGSARHCSEYMQCDVKFA